MSIVSQVLGLLKKNSNVARQAARQVDRARRSTAGVTAKEALERSVSAVTTSQTARALSQLNLKWSDASRYHDRGDGRVLNNEQHGLTKEFVDLYLSWEPQDIGFVRYHVVVGWKGWPDRVIDPADDLFNPDYLDALWENELNTVRRVPFEAGDVPDRCVRFPASEERNAFAHVKLIGEAADGALHDIRGVVFASEGKRAREEHLPAVDAHAMPDITVPGGPEKNAREEALTA